jgi:hypothetical protein
MDSKKWYQSKLFWLGVIMTLLGAIPVVQELLAKSPMQATDFVAFFGGILTVILRVWFTDKSISS